MNKIISTQETDGERERGFRGETQSPVSSGFGIGRSKRSDGMIEDVQYFCRLRSDDRAGVPVNGRYGVRRMTGGDGRCALVGAGGSKTRAGW